MGSIHTGGYGEVRNNGKKISAHRASYLVHKGEVGNGLFICHTCDVVSCVNPDHLYAGTPKENSQDSVRRGRRDRPAGEKNPQSKITDEIAKIIRYGGISVHEAVSRFGISKGRFYNIRSGAAWKHI